MCPFNPLSSKNRRNGFQKLGTPKLKVRKRREIGYEFLYQKERSLEQKLL